MADLNTCMGTGIYNLQYFIYTPLVGLFTCYVTFLKLAPFSAFKSGHNPSTKVYKMFYRIVRKDFNKDIWLAGKSDMLDMKTHSALYAN